MLKIPVFLVLLLMINSIVGQEGISIVVMDSTTMAPMGYVSCRVMKQGGDAGLTDLYGKVDLTCRKTDSIQFSFFGYETRTITANDITKRYSGEIWMSVNKEMEELGQVQIMGTDERVNNMIRKVIENRDQNDIFRKDYLEYINYTKIRLDVSNLTEKFYSRKWVAKMSFLKEFVDTVEGNLVLPCILVETYSIQAQGGKPVKKREIIIGNEISGFNRFNLSDFATQLDITFNIYANNIDIMNKMFISPLSNNTFDFYRFYLYDSITSNNEKYYKIKFEPKLKGTQTFNGYIWLEDTSYAVNAVQCEIDTSANLNFAEKILIEQVFTKQDSLWVLEQEKVFGRFNVTEELPGVYAHKTTIRKDFKFEPPVGDSSLISEAGTRILLDSARWRDRVWWDSVRLDSLSREELNIYAFQDSLAQAPIFKFLRDVGYMFGTGYYPAGPLEIGDLYSSFTFNAVENFRVGLSLRTSNKFSNKWEINGFLAYGTGDKKVKYGLGMKYKFDTIRRGVLMFDYYNDLEQFGKSPTATSNASILNSLFSTQPIDNLTFVRKASINVEKDWFTGFTTMGELRWKSYVPVGSTKYYKLTQGGEIVSVDELQNSEAQFMIRYAKDLKWAEADFSRQELGTIWPIITVNYVVGFKGLLGSDYAYHKLGLNLSYTPRYRFLGRTKFELFANKTWGRLPYPFLFLVPGNEAIFYQKRGMNLLNYFELIADQYMGIYFEHNFQGMLLDRIPLLREFKFRTIITAKWIMGSFRADNLYEMLLPPGTVGMTKPYMEVGVGLGNILSLFRIDAVWRVTEPEDSWARRFGLFVSFEFDF